MRTINFTVTAFSQYNNWRTDNKKIQDIIMNLILDIVRDPFGGLSKPEALKYDLKGYWSRRIDNEHRLVYQVRETDIPVVSCKDHYPKTM